MDLRLGDAMGTVETKTIRRCFGSGREEEGLVNSRRKEKRSIIRCRRREDLQ